MEEKIETEEAVKQLTAMCLMLYVRTQALYDLLQEVHGEIDQARFVAAIQRRRQSLPEDLRAAGGWDARFWQIMLANYPTG